MATHFKMSIVDLFLDEPRVIRGTPLGGRRRFALLTPVYRLEAFIELLQVSGLRPVEILLGCVSGVIGHAEGHTTGMLTAKENRRFFTG